MWFTIIIKFVLGNWKRILIGSAALFVLFQLQSLWTQFVDSRSDRATLECNEQQLQDQIASLEELLARQQRDNELQAEELEELNREASERRNYIDRLENVLNDETIEDDRISERTRQFWFQLNEEAKAIQNETPPSPL